MTSSKDIAPAAFEGQKTWVKIGYTVLYCTNWNRSHGAIQSHHFVAMKLTLFEWKSYKKDTHQDFLTLSDQGNLLLLQREDKTVEH